MDDKCNEHGLLLKLYCETCSYLICNKCNRQYHDNHEVVAPTAHERNELLVKQEIPTSKDDLKSMLADLREAVSQENERSAKLREQMEKRKAELEKLKQQEN